MLAEVQEWDNGQGMRFPKAILEKARINVGDKVNVSVKDGTIVINSLKSPSGAYDLKELVDKMPKGYEVEEVDWGAPVGKEEW